jgi:nicrotizing toxin Mtb-like protein
MNRPGEEWKANSASKVDEEAGGGHTHPLLDPTMYDPVRRNISWPANGGAVTGSEKIVTLPPGTFIDRMGSGRGSYFSPKGTPIDDRGILAVDPYELQKKGALQHSEHSSFEVMKPIDVTESKVAPAFYAEGGGIQYKASKSADELVKDGSIRKVT